MNVKNLHTLRSILEFKCIICKGRTNNIYPLINLHHVFIDVRRGTSYSSIIGNAHTSCIEIILKDNIKGNCIKCKRHIDIPRMSTIMYIIDNSKDLSRYLIDVVDYVSKSNIDSFTSLLFDSEECVASWFEEIK